MQSRQSNCNEIKLEATQLQKVLMEKMRIMRRI